MASSVQNAALSTENGHAPNRATEAVLRPSVPVSTEAKVVKGIDFNDYTERTLNVEDLVGHMAGMGFQASAVSEAVRMINGMVGHS